MIAHRSEETYSMRRDIASMVSCAFGFPGVSHKRSEPNVDSLCSRNCEKHQVRCDYMDTPTADDEPGPSSAPVLDWSPQIERILEHWQRTGEASLGNFVIDLHAQGHTYTKQDLHLMYYALSVASNKFTVWTGKTAK